METEYRRVLHKWAKTVVPDAKSIFDVEFDYSPGFGSTYTFENPSTDIIIRYKNEKGQIRTTWISPSDPEFVTMGELLQKLFAIAEQEDLANA